MPWARPTTTFFPRGSPRCSGRTTARSSSAGGRRKAEELVPHEDGLHTYLSTKFPLFDAAGVAYAVGGIATDITERKRAERALRESEQWFRSLSNCSPVGVFLTDIEGRCTYTNPRCQEIYGFTFEEGLGEGWSRFIHPEDRTRRAGKMVAARTPRRRVRTGVSHARPARDRPLGP